MCRRLEVRERAQRLAFQTCRDLSAAPWVVEQDMILLDLSMSGSRAVSDARRRLGMQIDQEYSLNENVWHRVRWWDEAVSPSCRFIQDRHR